MPGLSHAPPILPLSNSPLATRRFRSTSRRISYTLKNRAGKYAVPLSVGSIVALIFLALTWSRGPPRHYPSHRVKLYTREQIGQATFGTPSRLTDPYDNSHAPRPGRLPNKGDGDGNGVSSLVESEEELIAEDDLFWMNYKEPPPVSDEEEETNKEIEAHRQDVIQRNAVHSLKALIWWISEGNVIPNGWETPPKSYFEKFGGRGMERLLSGIGKGKQDPKGRGDRKKLLADGRNEESAFTPGWGDFAKEELRLVVFSKTYCPYSRRAKSILSNYNLNPEPYIIELDRRSDTGTIQNLLFHLTGRRTVPNIILDFKSLGGADELTLLDAEGGLQRTLQDAGLIRSARNAYLPDRFDNAIEDDKPYINVPDDLKLDDDEDMEVDEDLEIDEVLRDLDPDVEVEMERRRPVAQGKDPKAAREAPAPVDIQAAVRQAHRAVDRQEGYGAFQPQGWRDVPDAVLYGKQEDVLPRGFEEDVEVPQARHEVRDERSGGKQARGRVAGPVKPIERADWVPPRKAGRRMGQREEVGGRHPAREMHEVKRDDGIAQPVPGQAQNPIVLGGPETMDEETNHSPPDPWGNDDPWSTSEPRPQDSMTDELRSPDDMESPQLDHHVDFSWPEADKPSTLSADEPDSVPDDIDAQEFEEEDAPIPHADHYAVEMGESEAKVHDAPREEYSRTELDGDEDMEADYDAELREASLKRYKPVNLAKQYERGRGETQQARDRPADRQQRVKPALDERLVEPLQTVPREPKPVKAPQPRFVEKDGAAALAAAANLRRRPNAKVLRGAVDTAEVL